MTLLRPTLLALSLAAAFAATAAPLASGLDKSGMDTSTRIQDDLFVAMNGTWLKTEAIPADKSYWGTMAQVRDRTDDGVRAIVEGLAAQPAPAAGNPRKIADFYKAYTDTAAIDKAGLAPVKPWLDEVAALKDANDVLALMGRWEGNVRTALHVGVDQDSLRPDLYVAAFEQSGLGVPDRDYYLKDDARYVQARAAYAAYAEKLLSLSGDPQAAAHARDVLALETRLAQAQWSRVENRDPVKTYNPMPPAQVASTAPGLDWARFMAAARLPAGATVVVVQPPYLAGLGQALREVPVATWQAYLTVRRLDNAADVLPAAFRDARFQYRDATLAGLQQELPRGKQAVLALNGAMGEAVGQLYVAQHFPPAAKARMQALVGNLMKAYASSIDGLTWMSPATKAAAHQKLSKYALKIAYPDTWRDYSKLEVKAGDAFGNADRAAAFDYTRRITRVGGPVDRAEWHMTPQTVNAYYNPSGNEIVFPAAILQAPFFDMNADDAVNYGAIGAVIGHEISHGFDDQGSQYDGDGKLRNWWTADDRQAFEKLTAKLAAQYDAYEPIPGKHVNGHLTLGENIADLSGLQIAYKAYELSLNGQKSPVIDGLTGEQRFFLGYAQAWRSKLREARELQLLTMDPHSPGRYRADGAAVNHDGFHQAFGTKAGDGMWKAPEDRIRMW